MAEDTGTIISAEIQGVEMAFKCGTGTAKALMKMFSVLFGKDAAERRKYRADARLSKANLKELLDAKELSEWISNNPELAGYKEIVKTSEGAPLIIHIPETAAREGSAISMLCKEKGIHIPEDMQNNPIISERDADIRAYLEADGSLNMFSEDELSMSALSYLRKQTGAPYKDMPDDDLNDPYVCVIVRAQDAALYSDFAKKEKDAFIKNCDALSEKYKTEAKREREISESASDEKEKELHSRNAENFENAAKEARESRDEARKSNELAESMETYIKKPLIQDSEMLRDPKSAAQKSISAVSITADKAFSKITTEERIPAGRKLFMRGCDWEKPERKATWKETPPMAGASMGKQRNRKGTMKDPPFEDYVPFRYAERTFCTDEVTGLIYSDYQVFSDGRKTLAVSDKGYSKERWESEGVPKLKSSLGMTDDDTVIVGSTREAIKAGSPERGMNRLSEDAVIFQQKAEAERKLDENFNRAAIIKAAVPIAERGGSIFFEAGTEKEEGLIGVRNKSGLLKLNADGLTYDISLIDGKANLYDRKLNKTGKTINTQDLLVIGGREIPGRAAGIKLQKPLPSHIRK